MEKTKPITLKDLGLTPTKMEAFAKGARIAYGIPKPPKLTKGIYSPVPKKVT